LKNIQDELKRCRSPKDLIEGLRVAYSKIEYGDYWKKASDAVRKLEGLDASIGTIVDFILDGNMDTKTQRSTALDLSLQLVRMLKDAEDSAWKAVNGSSGTWCPDTAETIEALWSKLASRE